MRTPVLARVAFASLADDSHFSPRGNGLYAAVLAGLLGHPSFSLFVVEVRAIWDGGGLFGNAFTTSLSAHQMDSFALPGVEGKGLRGKTNPIDRKR